MKIPKYIENKLCSMERHSNKAEMISNSVYEWLQKQVDTKKFETRHHSCNRGDDEMPHHFILGDYDIGVEGHQMMRILVEHIQENYDYFKKEDAK